MCVLLSNIKLRVSLFGKGRAVYSLNSEIVSRLVVASIHHVRPCHPPACFHILSCSLPPLISHSSACTRPCALFILTRITSYSGCLLRICPSLWRRYQCVLNFPHTAYRFLTRPVADGSLSAKIAEELTYEKEAALESEPEFLKEFKSAGIWTVCFFFEHFFFYLWGHRH
jgi:hypothetical protein